MMVQLYVCNVNKTFINTSQQIPAKTEAHADSQCLLAQPNEDSSTFKNKHNQNCQKIQLYGSPTAKELKKKKHSPRPAGGAETGSRAARTCSRVRLADRAVPHSRADKPGGTTGEQDRPTTQGPSAGK